MNKRSQKISENVLLVSIPYWLPLGTIDPLMLSYLFLVAKAFCNKWIVIEEGKIERVLSRVRLKVNGSLK